MKEMKIMKGMREMKGMKKMKKMKEGDCFSILFIPFIFFISFIPFGCTGASGSIDEKEPVDYVNPYIGNISHLLVPTYPTIHLPNSMLRVIPCRDSYTDDAIRQLPVIMTGHRGLSAFGIHPAGPFELFEPLESFEYKSYSYDNESITPCRYSVYLDEEEVNVDFAPSFQSALYNLVFNRGRGTLAVSVEEGELETSGVAIKGRRRLKDSTDVYLYMEIDPQLVTYGVVEGNTIVYEKKKAKSNSAVILLFDKPEVKLRYGVSFISAEQARNNLKREINTWEVDEIARKGRDIWNETLGKISVSGKEEDAKTVFYTSLYRTYERMINISEDGRYYSGFDRQVHDDRGVPFYTDDWVWDTYRAAHPLRTIIEPEKETHMIQSYLRMAQQTPEGWMPTFPGVAGDSYRMNGNHAVAVILDACRKGLPGVNLAEAYPACKGAITEKSLLPWVRVPNTKLDSFYLKNGFFPALNSGEQEQVKEVDAWERRQAVAITLGACYDYWCLSFLAKALGKDDESDRFSGQSLNYRNLFNEETAFFHPKDSRGKFIQPFDYRFSGGLGARDYYDENNGWIYRWDVQHNIADLIRLMGGNEKFVKNLDQTFREPLGKSKYEFYSSLPDQTGNVGQFSMGNEPALHIPYLYNYAGKPWKTQKRIRALLDQWFRNDLMGIPGDEDGGGLSAFVVFSSLGFYPVTPGLPVYVIGSPVFEKISIQLPEGNTFSVHALNYSPDNKYIQSAKLNGREWNRSWFSHEDLIKGGVLELTMGKEPNKKWAATSDAVPPSFELQP
jgi:predicted alpha-1,2-mannosidase